MTSNTWRVRACKAERETNPEPLTMHVGDQIAIVGKEEDGWVWCSNEAGKEDWVPLSYLTAEGEGPTRTALVEYDSTVFRSQWEKNSRSNWKSMAGCGVRMRRENGGGFAWPMWSVSTRRERRGGVT